jgi:hypothetical protein
VWEKELKSSQPIRNCQPLSIGIKTINSIYTGELKLERGISPHFWGHNVWPFILKKEKGKYNGGMYVQTFL